LSFSVGRGAKKPVKRLPPRKLPPEDSEKKKTKKNDVCKGTRRKK